jgi:flavin reductase (DIM6/NTAB) family NADH-FMN oxidoreductase RutF
VAHALHFRCCDGPLVLITTQSETGVVNAAPFSVFNMLGEEPPIVRVSINRLSDGELKDTAPSFCVALIS